MIRSLVLSGLVFSLTGSAYAQSWSCTCRDAEANDIGGVTVETAANGSWNEAVRKANAECKRQYPKAADGANCDSVSEAEPDGNL